MVRRRWVRLSKIYISAASFCPLNFTIFSPPVNDVRDGVETCYGLNTAGIIGIAAGTYRPVDPHHKFPSSNNYTTVHFKLTQIFPTRTESGHPRHGPPQIN